MKQMYTVVLGDDDGKTIDSDMVYSLESFSSAAKNTIRFLNERNMECYLCEVMVDIVRIGDDGKD